MDFSGQLDKIRSSKNYHRKSILNYKQLLTQNVIGKFFVLVHLNCVSVLTGGVTANEFK